MCLGVPEFLIFICNSDVPEFPDNLDLKEDSDILIILYIFKKFARKKGLRVPNYLDPRWKTLAKRMAEIIHANVVHHRFPFAESHKFRVRRRRNFDSAVAESTYEWISPIVYVMNYVERTALSGNWGGNHVSSSPTPRQRSTRRRTTVPLCIVSFPPIKLTTGNFLFTRRHLYVNEKCRCNFERRPEVMQENPAEKYLKRKRQ